MISCKNPENKQLRIIPELKGGDEMEKEETRIVIVCRESEDTKSDNVTVYTNNPHADTDELLSMLAAHVAYFIRNMILDHVPPSDVAKMIENAVKIAANRYMDNMDNTKGAE